MRFRPPLRSSLALLLLAAPLSAQIVGANPDSIPNASWVDIYFRGFDRAATAAGLTPLRETPLGAEEREVRLWTQAELGVPKHLYRISDRRGRVRGEAIDYWSISPANRQDDASAGESLQERMLYRLRGRCDQFRASTNAGTCRARFRGEPPWERVLRAAESHGLWTLPDPSTLPRDNRITLDGWTLVVELRHGPRYRTYRYHNPGSHPAWPSDAQARSIARALNGIDSLIRLPDVRKVYRGLTTGRYGTAFRPCDGSASWDFHGDVSSLIVHAPSRIRDAAPPQAADSSGRDSTVYDVEVLGELTTEGVARQMQSKFPRVLQVLELRAMRPASTGGCSPPAP